MKFLTIILTASFFGIFCHAEKLKLTKKVSQELRKDDCQKKLTSLVSLASKTMGVNGDIGIHWADPIKKGNSSNGQPTFEYATGVFIFDGGTAETEGFLPDSGAKALVIKQKNSCKILKIEISIGS